MNWLGGYLTVVFVAVLVVGPLTAVDTEPSPKARRSALTAAALAALLWPVLIIGAGQFLAVVYLERRWRSPR